MEKIWGGFGENTHGLEKNAKMLEKINTIICFGKHPKVRSDDSVSLI